MFCEHLDILVFCKQLEKMQSFKLITFVFFDCYHDWWAQILLKPIGVFSLFIHPQSLQSFISHFFFYVSIWL
jgi:hypothetical protein